LYNYFLAKGQCTPHELQQPGNGTEAGGQKKKTHPLKRMCFTDFVSSAKSAGLPLPGETVAAVYRSPILGLKWNHRLLAAGSTDRRIHFSVGISEIISARFVFASGTAVLATGRFVCIAFLREKLLFADGEYKAAPAVFAHDGFVLFHLNIPHLKILPPLFDASALA
jgi:hypothetical protein